MSPAEPTIIGTPSSRDATSISSRSCVCHASGLVDVSEPSGIGPTSSLPESAATIGHALSHTSAGTPGETFVYDPARRLFPQTEETEYYLAEGYGGQKRQAELALIHGDTGALAWTIVRPCHIYGPGSRLGCLPLHGRDPQLIERLRAGEPLRLVGGGHFLQQPILARDLADLILSLLGNPASYGQVLGAAGPDTVESRTFYQIIADSLGVPLTVEEVSVQAHRAAHPEAAPFLCHRIYDLSRLKAVGVSVPSTPLAVGLAEHVASLLA